MKRKGFSLALAVAMLASLSLASCAYTHEQHVDLNNDGVCDECTHVEDATHEHTYSEFWSANATHHWHATDCGHSLVDGKAEHTLNAIGDCIVCGVNVSDPATHEHTYSDAWSANATHHWHATDCGHSLVDGKAEHTLNAIGDCTVCGADVSDPAVDTVADAIDLAVEQGDLVSAGKIKAVMQLTGTGEDPVESCVDYVVAENYTHYVARGMAEGYYEIMQYYQEYWFSTYEDVNGEVKAFGAERGGSSVDVVPFTGELKAEMVDGVAFETLFYTEGSFYGVEDLVEGLYETGKTSANGLFTETVEEGVYAFAYEYYNVEMGYMFPVAVEFELGENYNFKNVVVSVDRYIDITVEGEGEDAVYSITEDAEPNQTSVYYIEQATGEGYSAENTADELLMTSYKLVDSEEAEVGATAINFTAGEFQEFTLADVAPVSASTDFDKLAISVKANDVALEEYVDYTWYETEDGFAFSTRVAGEMTVTVATAKLVKTFDVVSVLPEITNIYVESASGETDSAEIYEGKSFMFDVIAEPEYCDGAYTVEVVSAPAESTAVIVYDDVMESETFMPDKLGEYQFKVVSTADETVFSTFTLTVVAKPTAAELFTGTFYVDSDWTPMMVEFTPDTDAKTGTVEVSVDATGVSEVLTYSYDNTTDLITLTHVSGDEVLGMLTIQADFSINAIYNPGAPYNVQMGTLAVYTPPQPIDEIHSEWIYLVGEYPWLGDGEGRYFISFSGSGCSLSLQKYDEASWSWYDIERVEFNVSCDEYYNIEITEITDGSIDGFDVDAQFVYTEEEVWNEWWGEYEYFYSLTVEFGGTLYEFEMF